MIFKTQNNLKYLDSLSVAGEVTKVRYQSGVELMRLKERKKVWKTGNLELRHGLPLLVYSPYSDKYWYRCLLKDHDLSYYRTYIKDGNLYIAWNDQWKEMVKEEREIEGLPYRAYNTIRELTLIGEYLDKSPDKSDYKTKKRIIDLKIKQLKQQS